ncbi:HamA C-terminal domain-containing protein [Bacillus sp. K2I17]|uniref:HamA C-terminal domain-containing protein n=1 Tax=Bacillus sp. K2I17 TaxID=2014743 RepID=UPI000B515AB7|nr:Hachiman antiphage defense system protein HamA [Bacillus sp. K2I17]OWT48738.1 hypothetical protein CER22_24155 [Bacillus sp. K2I17]
MLEIIDKLHMLTSKLSCGEQGTAFLIDKNRAVTARHAVKQNILYQHPIKLEFYISEGNTIIRSARVIDHDKTHDIAILELDKAVTHVNGWLQCSSRKIENVDDWETVGFPRDWITEGEGSRYCYIKGDIFLRTKTDATAKYDIHLASDYIKEEWPHGFGGLSGAPLIVNGDIVGVIIDEEYSAIKSPLKAVSIEKSIDIFTRNNISVLNDSANQPLRMKHLLSERMELQQNTCKELFQNFEYYVSPPLSELSISVNSYHLKYDGGGTHRIKELAKHLGEMLIKYACTLSDINKLNNSLTVKNLEIIKEKTDKCISRIKSQGELGPLMLWMLLEGVLGLPRVYTRANLYDLEPLNQVHVGINNDNKFSLYFGDGRLKDSFDLAIQEVIESLTGSFDSKSPSLDAQDSMYLLDNYAFDCIDSCRLKDLLDPFTKPHERDWTKVAWEVTIFTGYNSSTLSNLAKRNLSKEELEQVLRHSYEREYRANLLKIYDLIKENIHINQLKIHWFMLPFNTVEELENLVLEEIRRGI